MAKYNRTKIALGLSGIAGLLVAMVSAMPGCGVTPPRKVSLPLGTTTVLPSIPFHEKVAPKPSHSYANLRLVINFEGRIIGPADDAELLMYESEASATPKYRFSTKALQTAYQDTKCSQQLVNHLNNAITGDALFCNHALDISKMRYFVLKLAGHPDETATSYLTEYIDQTDELLSITIAFM